MSIVCAKKFLPLLACALLFVTGPTAQAASQDGDPLESVNRAIFVFNQTADAYVLRPIVVGYRYVAPPLMRRHIGNVTDNLFEPVNAVNALLQGDLTQGVTSFWRFVINSTLGIAGINDVATEAGLPEREEDFGQTLAVWGVGPGPYLMLPILGPSNLRDTTGKVADIFTNPINYYVDTNVTIGMGVADGIVARDRLFTTIDDVNSSSLDPYAAYRTMYQQHRQALIENHDKASRNSDNNLAE